MARHRFRKGTGLRAAVGLERTDRISEGRPFAVRATHGHGSPPHFGSIDTCVGTRAVPGRWIAADGGGAKDWFGARLNVPGYRTMDRTCSATRSVRISQCEERQRGRFRNSQDIRISPRRSGTCTSVPPRSTVQSDCSSPLEAPAVGVEQLAGQTATCASPRRLRSVHHVPRNMQTRCHMSGGIA
jgi:hypothetical protein